ncbi:LysR family transcriptional regulator [Thalassospira australica]|uniref:LysR family transcriptional regulator n=1 Tax=Thalassospira australica TaxID=1528106 RepID=UPI00051A1C47|nr:LysR substrate-binding domain-containing protein [Thalassospira australica]
MELRWLEDFIALSETLNFSRASEMRNITQPAFSRRIRALENWVGVSLVARTTHSVQLTPSGQQFLSHARAVCFSLTQARREAMELARLSNGTLNIAATHALSFTFMPEWLRSRNEQVSLGPLNLISDSMQACESLMQRGEIDFLIAHAHPDAPADLQHPLFMRHIIGSDRLIPVISPSLARNLVKTGSPAPYLAYSVESGLGRIIAAANVTLSGLDPSNPGFTSHLAATLHSMAKGGAGVAWLPESLAQRDIANGQLEVLGMQDRAIPVDIEILRPRRRLSPLAEKLWASLENA